MKKFFYTAFLLFVLLFSSCQEEKQTYSCDPTIDQWVKNNLDEIQSMTRATWKTLPENFKGATFGAFTPQQKITFWKERLNVILELDWNTKEQEHIQKLHFMVQENPLWFDVSNRTEEIEDAMAIAAYSWIQYAKENLHWDKRTIGGIIASGNDLVDKTGLLEINPDHSQQLSTRSESNCNCNQTYDFCSGVEDKCKDSSCKEVNMCGWLLLSKCNGSCGMS